MFCVFILKHKDEQEDCSPSSTTKTQSVSINKRWSRYEIDQHNNILKPINFTFIKQNRDIYDFISSKLKQGMLHNANICIVLDNKKYVFNTVNRFYMIKNCCMNNDK